MPLVRKRHVSPEQLAANRANARQSHGAVTPEGKGRVRMGCLKHGLYSRFFQEAMGALGEDPAEFELVHEGLVRYWNPQDPLAGTLIKRLARLMWRLDRIEARQESFGTRHVRAAEVREAARAKAVDPQLDSILEQLDSLQGALRARDWPRIKEAIEEWYRGHGINTDQERQVFQSMNRVVAAASAPAEAQEELAKELEGLVAEEIELVEQRYEDFRDEQGAAAARRWLERVESSTNPDALYRADDLISRELERTVRLLLQLNNGQEAAGDGQPKGGTVSRVGELLNTKRPRAWGYKS